MFLALFEVDYGAKKNRRICNIKQAEVSRHLMALCPRATINLVTKVASEEHMYNNKRQLGLRGTKVVQI